jgi:hypothetical protein
VSLSTHFNSDNSIEHFCIWEIVENVIDDGVEDAAEAVRDGASQVVQNIAPILVDELVHVLAELAVAIKEIREIHVQSLGGGERKAVDN